MALIVCAPVPLKLTVDPVTVYAPAPGVNVPQTPIVPEEASTRAPPLAFRLPKFHAGMVCEEPLLMVTVEAQFNDGVADEVEDSVPVIVKLPALVVVKLPVPLNVKLITVRAELMLKVFVPGEEMVTLSAEVGTPLGVQLALVPQSVSEEPFQV